MKKIFVDKNEGVAEVVEKIIGDPASEIVFTVPKNAALGESVSNFHLIKREAESAGKKVLIESVDEEILALAKASRLEASHPLFEGEKKHSSLSDIVPRRLVRGEKPELTSPPNKGKKRRVETEVREVEVSREVEPIRSGGQAEYQPAEGKRFWWKLIFGVVLFAVVVVFIGWAATKFYSRATVTISFKKTPWTYEHSFLADTSASKVNLDENILPAELFASRRNLTQLFPASDMKNVSSKARGRITIYNAYSSQPQVLVATTRFLTPDGKIFRLADKVTVPAAAIKNGDIVPSHINADVVAEAAGPDYNIGPVPRLTIPGLKGSPKYKGFYGELKEQSKGGFVGQKAVPNSEDVKNAKDKTTEILRTSLENGFLNSYPPDFRILDGASAIEITKLDVNENTDPRGNFSVFGEAKLTALGFRESDIKSFLKFVVSRDNPSADFDELHLNYSQVKPDFRRKAVSFSLSADAVLRPSFSADDFRTKILSRDVGEARSLISALPGLANAKVSLWPIWLGRIPIDPRRVSILVN